MYTCHLLKLDYKLYTNRLPTNFESFMTEYGKSNHNLRNCTIHLPDVRCEFDKLYAKYQMHLRLRELAIPLNPPIHFLIDINDEILSKSNLKEFIDYYMQPSTTVLDTFFGGSKAFDKINVWLLFQKLFDKGPVSYFYH